MEQEFCRCKTRTKGVSTVRGTGLFVYYQRCNDCGLPLETEEFYKAHGYPQPS